MTKQFLTSTEVFVVKGYLSKDAKKVDPIRNQKFIDAQKHAEYVITFAEKAKGKDFVGKKADSLEALKAEVAKALSTTDTTYLKAPEAPAQTIQSKLAKEAMAFVDYGKTVEKTEKVNEFLQQFNVLNEFSEVGLFFEQEIVKLNKIYTIDEVVKAVESVIDLLED